MKDDAQKAVWGMSVGSVSADGVSDCGLKKGVLADGMGLDLDEWLSPHFRLREFMRSGSAIRLGIRNYPLAHPLDGLTNEELLRNLRRLCRYVLEPLRREVGRVIITSGYRCKALNRAVGGAERSLHMRGRAADIHIGSAAECRKFMRVLRGLGRCTELLAEPRGGDTHWIHVAF